MSTSDPGGTPGNQTYPPDPPRCVCGEAAGVHEVKPGGKWGKCSAGGPEGPCPCRQYAPKEEP